jgi:manganese transport protein
LFGIPLLAGMGVTAVITYAILMTEGRGFRPIELIIGGFVSAIALCYVLELLIAPVEWSGVIRGTLVPQLLDRDAVTIAVGIVGATVMPHALYLHSGLTQARVASPTPDMRRRLLVFSNREVVVALTLAGVVNMAMVIMAAGAFHDGHTDVAEIETAYRTLTPLLGAASAAVFLISLLASGISSSVVGTMAGQLVMQGFVGFRIPIWVRRAVTMIPALVVVALGVNPTQTLIFSQVVLSLVLPIPMIALVWLTQRRDVMGEFVNSRFVQVLSVAGALAILVLNIVLLLQMAGYDVIV